MSNVLVCANIILFKKKNKTIEESQKRLQTKYTEHKKRVGYVTT